MQQYIIRIWPTGCNEVRCGGIQTKKQDKCERCRGTVMHEPEKNGLVLACTGERILSAFLSGEGLDPDNKARVPDRASGRVQEWR